MKKSAKDKSKKRRLTAAEVLKGSKLISEDPEIISTEFSNRLRKQLELRFYGDAVPGTIVDKLKGFFKLNFTKPALFGMGMLTSFFGFIFLLISFGIPNNFTARPTVIDGQVEIRALNSDSWQKVKPDTIIREGDELRTAQDSRAEISMLNGNTLRLDSNTDMKFAELNSDEIAVQQISGNLYHSVTDNKINYKVVVDDYEVVALATSFATTKEARNFRIKVIDNSVQVKSSASEKPQVVSQGNQYESQGKGKPDVQPIMENERKTSFLLWNRNLETIKGADLGILVDVDSPTVTVTAPSDGASITAREVILKGTTEAGAVVTVNGKSVTNYNGNFTERLMLTRKENLVNIKAVDAAGNTTVKTVTLYKTDKESSVDVNVEITKVPRNNTPLNTSVPEITVKPGDNGTDYQTPVIPPLMDNPAGGTPPVTEPVTTPKGSLPIIDYQDRIIVYQKEPATQLNQSGN